MTESATDGTLAASVASCIAQGFEDYHHAFAQISRRARERFQRRDWAASGTVPPANVLALKEHWDFIGENRFATAGRAHYAVFNENFYVRA